MRINKQIGIIIITFFWLNLGFGQSQKSFEKLIAKTNNYLEKYSKLSPFGSEEFISLDKSGLPKNLINEINKNYMEYDGYTQDSISEFNLILEFQGVIIENLTSIISHKKFKDNKIEDLIRQDFDLSIAVSDDKKLFNFSLDEKTGGTYRSRISITHYTNDSIVPSMNNNDPHEIINQHQVFEGDGFDNIYSLETEQGTKYVLTGFVRGCSSCFELNLMLVNNKSGFFEKDFSYIINTRFPQECTLDYNSTSKTIVVDYITDDLTTDCDCTNYAMLDENEYNNYSDSDETEPITKRCHCTFEFNGLNFELVKESWEKEKE